MSKSDTPTEDGSHWHTSREDLEAIAAKYPEEDVGRLAQLLLDSREETN